MRSGPAVRVVAGLVADQGVGDLVGAVGAIAQPITPPFLPRARSCWP